MRMTVNEWHAHSVLKLRSSLNYGKALTCLKQHAWKCLELHKCKPISTRHAKRLNATYVSLKCFSKSAVWTEGSKRSTHLCMMLTSLRLPSPNSLKPQKANSHGSLYQVRYPSVSGTGAGWRNLELSPLPLSNNQYVFNKRRYHQPQELCHWAI